MSDPTRAAIARDAGAGAALRRGPAFLWLRIGLAFSVVLAHFSAISGDEQAGFHAISSLIAVQAFFVISGWIVAASFDRSATLVGFWVRRFVRLYPLYATVVCVQALLALALTTSALDPAHELARYLVANLAFANFLQPSLLGLFSDAPVQAINPSLWTLKIEVMFYLVVPLLVLFLRARGRRALLWLYLGSSVFFYLAALRSDVLARQFAGQLRYFVAGMVCWQLAAAGFGRDWSVRSLAPIALIALIGSHALEHAYWLSLVQPLLVATFIYAAAHCLPEPSRMPDISYGVYLLHAPLMQVGFMYGFWRADVPGLMLAIAATSALATVSWYGLERPAIRAGKRWLERTEATGRAPASAARVDQVTL